MFSSSLLFSFSFFLFCFLFSFSHSSSKFMKLSAFSLPISFLPVMAPTTLTYPTTSLVSLYSLLCPMFFGHPSTRYIQYSLSLTHFISSLKNLYLFFAFTQYHSPLTLTQSPLPCFLPHLLTLLTLLSNSPFFSHKMPASCHRSVYRCNKSGSQFFFVMYISTIIYFFIFLHENLYFLCQNLLTLLKFCF